MYEWFAIAVIVAVAAVVTNTLFLDIIFISVLLKNSKLFAPLPS